MSQGLASHSLDDCLGAIESERRCDVLLALLDADPDTALAVGAIADENERVERSLVHCHLPVLDDEEYVDWDRETGRVARGAQFDHVDAVLELLRSHEDDLPWDVA